MTVAAEQIRVAAIYNPQNQDKNQLIEGFVVRQKIFQRLFNTIKEAKMEVPEQHYLLLGRRGMGKTTLLLRLAYAIEDDPDVNTRLIPLVFNEEEYGVRRLFNFWERIMELLAQRLPDSRLEESERKQLSAAHKDDDDAYERALYDLLSEELQRTGKQIILFVDNFGNMARKLNDAEAHRLRKILQSNADIRIFAASSVVLEAFYRYDHPFYEFFKVVELQGLDEKETRELLLRLAQYYRREAVARIVEQHPGRVEALRRITGGVIRTMVLLFEIFADEEDGSAFKDLEVILDRTTPLYKHRMDDLSDQQQAIVEAIALNWDALSVREIVERTRLDSKIISAQLQQLEKNGIIEKRATTTKNHLYLVAERFFNIWFLMRHGRRSDEKRVLWLVRFFEDWCDADMMKSRVELHRQALLRGGFDPDAALTYTQALAQSQKLSAAEKHDLLYTTKMYLQEWRPELANDLALSDLDLAYEALQLWYGEEKQLAIKKLRPLAANFLPKEKLDELAQAKDAADELAFCERVVPLVSLNLSFNFQSLKNPQEEKVAQCLIWPAENGDVATSFFLNAAGNDFGKLAEWYQQRIKARDPRGMFALGLFNIQKDIEKAIEWFEKASKEGHPGAMFLLGDLFETEKKDIDKAILWYERAAKLGHVKSMFFLGAYLALEKGEIDKAIEWIEKAAKRGDSDAMNILGTFWEKMKKDPENALQWYEKAALKGDSSAMKNTARLLFKQKQQKEKALHWVEKSLQIEPINEWKYHTAACIYAWNGDLLASKKNAAEFLQNGTFIEQEPDAITSYFIILLAKNEAKWLLQLFTSAESEALQLKDRFKPVYYAALKQLDHPDFLRMGEELAQTVDEVLAQARQMAVDYA